MWGSDDGCWCGDQLANAAADRLEEFMERCARYADEAMHRSVMLPREDGGIGPTDVPVMPMGWQRG